MGLRKKGIPFRKLVIYWFENTLSSGTRAVVIWLAAFTLIIALVSGLIITIFNIRPVHGSGGYGFMDAFWKSLEHTIDTGAIQADTAWGFRIIALAVTLAGVLIFSALVGVLTSGLERAFEKIRKGKSEILLNDFTLILGWSPAVFKIIHELVLAHAGRRGRHLVILAERDKIAMEDDLNLKIRQKEILRNAYPDSRDYRNELRIHCRSGNPLDIDNLKLVHPENAKSIIILPPHDSMKVLSDDAFVLKTTLALENQPGDVKLKPHIISILNEPDVRDALKHWERGRKSYLKKNNIFIPDNEWLAKITAQTCGQPGFSSVLTEILNYEKSEIYIIPSARGNKQATVKDHSLLRNFEGREFDELVLACVNAIPLGIERKTDRGMEQILNPGAKYPAGDKRRMLCASDRVIMMLQDEDEKIMISDVKMEPRDSAAERPQGGKPVKRILVLGWNKRITCICGALCGYLAEGAEITIIADHHDPVKFAEQGSRLQRKINSRHPHVGINCFEGNTTRYGDLDHVDVNSYSSILVLGYDELDIQEKDARTILTLLNLQAIIKNRDINIVAELYDDKNRRIVEITQTCDFIISDNIISSLMAQLSQESLLYPIYRELFDARGCEIYLKSPAAYSIEIDRETRFDFGELKKATLKKNDILFGYRKDNDKHDHERNYGVYFLTDLGDAYLDGVMLSMDDRLIVLSTNE